MSPISLAGRERQSGHGRSAGTGEMRAGGQEPLRGCFRAKGNYPGCTPGSRAGIGLPTLLRAVEKSLFSGWQRRLLRGRIELLVMLPLRFPIAEWDKPDFLPYLFLRRVFLTILFYFCVSWMLCPTSRTGDGDGERGKSGEDLMIRGIRGEIRPACRSQEPQHAATSRHLFYTRGKFGERGELRRFGGKGGT